MTVIITGAASMLGRHIAAACRQRGEQFSGFGHGALDVTDLADVTRTLARYDEGDVLVNCAGVRPGGDPIAMLQVNALAPHYLDLAATRQGFRLIHVSTDCVFSGLDRHRAPVRHNALETPNPRDHYGRTKLAGEPFGPMTTVVRTSFVGPDHGLWAWIANQPEGAMVEVINTQTGKPADIGVFDRATGKPIAAPDYAMVPGPAANARIRKRYARRKVEAGAA